MKMVILLRVCYVSSSQDVNMLNWVVVFFWAQYALWFVSGLLSLFLKKIKAAKSAAFSNSNIFHSFSKPSHLFQLKVISLKAFVWGYFFFSLQPVPTSILSIYHTNWSALNLPFCQPKCCGGRWFVGSEQWRQCMPGSVVIKECQWSRRRKFNSSQTEAFRYFTAASF